MNNSYISIKENIKLLSILNLIILSYIYRNSYFIIFCITWCLNLVIIGNARRFKRKNKIFYFLRMSLYFTPYSIPYIIGYRTNFNSDYFLVYSIIIIFIFCSWLFLNRNIIRIILSKQVVYNTKKRTKFELLLLIYNFVGASLCEELYFRCFILSFANSVFMISFLTLLNSVYFVLAHYLLPWSQEFKKKDYLNQLIFSIINSIIFILSKSIFYCIALHFLINSISILRIFKEYERHYINPNKYYFSNKKKYYEELEL